MLPRLSPRGSRAHMRSRSAAVKVFVVVLAAMAALWASEADVQAQCQETWTQGLFAWGGADLGVAVLLVTQEPTGPALYMGGSFHVVGSARANAVARWDQATASFMPLGLGVDGSVRALAFMDGKVYVGGEFASAGGVASANIACWDSQTQTWSALGPGVTGTVYALAALGGKLYVGGGLTKAGDTAVDGVASWDPVSQTWSAVGAGLNSGVYALAVFGGELYAGGSFARSGSVTTNRLARWDLATQTWVGVGGGVDNTVYALAVFRGRLYVGGAFREVGALSADYLAFWDPVPQAWSKMPGKLDGIVRSLFVSGDDLYVGGEFRNAAQTRVNYVARWRPATLTWSALGGGMSSDVSAVTVFDGKVFVAGAFVSSASGVRADHIAYWNLATETWSPVSPGSAGASPTADPLVYALTGSGGKLYAGGVITQIGGVGVGNIACWDRASRTWSSLGAGVSGVSGGNSPSVRALTRLNGKIYAGGEFIYAGDQTVNHIACWDPDQQEWSALSAGIAFGSGVAVNGMCALHGRLYVVGAFIKAGDVNATKVACWDPATQTWSALGAGVTGFPYAVAALGGKLYVGGYMTGAGGTPVKNIACWDPAAETWSALGPGLDASSGGASQVYGLAAIDGYLYAVGTFTRAGTIGVPRVARWDPVTQTWSRLGPYGLSGADGAVYASAVAGLAGRVYVGGAFTSVGSLKLSSIAAWDNASQSWSNMEGGVGWADVGGRDVYALTTLDGRLYASGSFRYAGQAATGIVAEWAGPCVPADVDRDGDVDLADFQGFLACFNGMDQPPAQRACDSLDADADGDVDLSDFASFMACFNGPNRPPSCAM